MKRACYREAVALIAMNDNLADDGPAHKLPDHPDNAQVVESIAGYSSTMFVCCLFGVEKQRVACDVLRVRIRELGVRSAS